MPKLQTRKIRLSLYQLINNILVNNKLIDDGENKSVIEELIYLYENFKNIAEVDHWTAITNHYFEFYASLNNGNNPAFIAGEPTALREISILLKKRYLLKHPGASWGLDIAIKQHDTYYNSIIVIPYVKRYFSIRYAYNNFDKINSELSFILNNNLNSSTTSFKEMEESFLKQ